MIKILTIGLCTVHKLGNLDPRRPICWNCWTQGRQNLMEFYLSCTGSASRASPAARTTPPAHSLPKLNDCRVTIELIGDNIIQVQSLFTLQISLNAASLSIDWPPANLQLRHKFKHVTSSSVSDLKHKWRSRSSISNFQKRGGGHLLKFSPAYKKRGRCADIKMRGRGRWGERKHFSLQSNPRHKFFSDLKHGVKKWEEGYPRLALSRREAPLAAWLHLQMPHWVPVLALGRGSTHRNNPISCS